MATQMLPFSALLQQPSLANFLVEGLQASQHSNRASLEDMAAAAAAAAARERAAAATSTAAAAEPAEQSQEDAPEDHKLREKLRKRRSQIAAASRKSRAKRKAELQELRDQNSALQDEVFRLRERLKQVGETGSLPQEVGSATAKEEPQAQHQHQHQHQDSDSVASSCGTDEGFTGERTVEELLETHPELQPAVAFMQKRMNWFLQGLKTDVSAFFQVPKGLQPALAELDVALLPAPGAASSPSAVSPCPSKKRRLEQQ